MLERGRLGGCWSLLLGCVACGPAATEPCNGDVALCDRPFDQVVLPATHNAMSNGDDGWFAPNQQHPPARQLEDGIRGMLLDSYDQDGVPMLCHGPCVLGSTPLAEVLADLRTFLDDNPRELVLLLFEDYLSLEVTEGAFDEAGLLERAYAHPSPRADWPTLGALLEDGLQLVVTRQSEEPGPDWYQPFYELGFDTPYSFRDASEFSCDVLRGKQRNSLFLMNHWVSDPLPTRQGAVEVNQADVIEARARSCAEARGRMPTLVAVDFYDEGDLFGAVRRLNGLDE